MPTFREFRSGDRVTRITRTGIDDGPGYVLVHGIGMAHEYWSDVAESLGRTGPVHALDLPGFGDSPEPERPLSMAAAGDLLAELVEAEGIANPVLIGHSSGAQAVAEAAARHPLLFDRIVLIGPTVNPRERSVTKQAARLAQDLVLAHPKVLGLGLWSYARAGVGWYLETLRPVLAHRIERTLPSITAQTLVIRGERDRIVPREWAEQVTRIVPNARLIEVPGRGHETMITAGALVGDLIVRHARGDVVGAEVPDIPEPESSAAPTAADSAKPIPLFAAAGWWALDYLDAAKQQLRVLTVPKLPRRWARGDAGKPTVLLLPGVYEHWSFMEPLGDALNAHGYRVQVAHGLGANLLAIPETAERVRRALARIPVPPEGRVVVAHSKGGLIGKHLLLRDVDHRLDLRGLVAIATPFRGARLSRYLLDPSMREFDPDSATIVELASAASVNSRIVSLFGVFDPHLPEGSSLAGATNRRLPVAGHFRILSTPQTAEAVVAAVESLSAPLEAVVAAAVATIVAAKDADAGVDSDADAGADADTGPATDVADDPTAQSSSKGRA